MRSACISHAAEAHRARACRFTLAMGSSCCLQDKRGEERTPIAGPNIKEATGRLERQKESLEESIEKLRQDLENSR